MILAASTPTVAPTTICMPKSASPEYENSPAFIYDIVAIASKNAIGSLLPLSSSNSGRKFSFNASPLERKSANTDAESVEDITDAKSKDCGKVKLKPKKDATAHINAPVKNAVKTTPKVASTTPGNKTGLMSENLVSTPPENSMIESDIMPMNCAVE